MIRKLLGLLFGPAFGSSSLSVRSLMRQVFVQKILRINADVPWPVHWTSVVVSPSGIERGSRFPGLSMCCYLDGRAGIRFGENVWVGPRVTIVSKNHDLNRYESYVESGPVVIGRDSWLGASCIVLPGVVIGPHTVVAAGAVVTTSFPDGNQVLAGCPARVVRKLPNYGVEA